MSNKIMSAKEIKELMEGTTSGPWHAHAGPMGNINVTTIDSHGIYPDDKQIVILDQEDPSGWADAHLIAAAPDLASTALDALTRVEELEKHIDWCHQTMVNNGINHVSSNLPEYPS